MDCRIETKRNTCNFTYFACERKGRCCECLSYRLGLSELPASAFPADIERSYDRSFQRFIQAFSRGEKG